MAKIGLKHLVGAPIETEPENAMPVYGTGFRIGKAVSADTTLNSNDNPLYADDSIAENDTSFADGTIALTVADFGTSQADTLDVVAKIFGHTLVEDEETGVPSLFKASGDNAPYLGIGYYRTKRINNEDVFEAKWIFKTKFQLPSESDATKGQTITWGTSQISGRVIASNYEGRYEEQKTFKTPTEAANWLDTRANIIVTGG